MSRTPFSDDAIASINTVARKLAEQREKQATATIIPFPTPTPATAESECPMCKTTASRAVADCVGLPVITCACGCMFFDEIV